MSERTSGDEPRYRFTRRQRRWAAVGVVVAVVAVIVGVSRLLAPSDAEILALAAPSASAWRQPGMITHYTTIIRQRNPETGEPEKLTREHWVSFEGAFQREATIRVGTPRTFLSIYEPDSLRADNVAEETSSTVSTNREYRAREVETAEGLYAVVDTAPSGRHAVWWGPCGSCHAPKMDAAMLASAQAGLPPYLASVNRNTLRVVGRGRVRGRRTWVLEAERPSVPEGYREVTRIDVDRKTYLPLRYRVQIVQDLAKAGQDVVETTDIDITSHELIPESKIQEGWFALSLPPSLAYAARQSFDSAGPVTWPPSDTTPPRTLQKPPIYDLGRAYPILGGLLSGVRFRTLPPSPASSTGGSAGRPDAIVEDLHPAPGPSSIVRVLTEYGEVTPPGSEPKWGNGDETLADGAKYSALIRVVTMPRVSDAAIREWSRGASVTRFSAGGRPAYEIRGASIEDSVRPFDYGAVVVQMPDATVVITQPPHAVDAPSLVREAAGHLVKRQ